MASPRLRDAAVRASACRPPVVHYRHADLRILLQPVRNRLRGAGPQRHEAASAPSVTPATSAGCCPRSPSTHRRPTSAARERPRAAPPAPAPPVAPATDEVIAALDALREEVERCSSCVLAEIAHQGGVRRGRPRRRPHVRRRGARLPRGPAGPAVRRPGRQAPRAAARVHRHDPRAGLHRQRPQEPPAQQPRPAAGGDRRLPSVPVAADRDHRAQGHLHAGQLRDQAPQRGPDRHHQGARAPARDRDRRAPVSTCIRSSILPRRSTRRRC